MSWSASYGMALRLPTTPRALGAESTPMTTRLSFVFWLLCTSCGCATQQSYPKSDHYDGTHFGTPGMQVTRGLGDLLRWQLLDTKTAWPKQCPPQAAPKLATPADAQDIVITFIGHATHLIEHKGVAILTDPIFSTRASPVTWWGPKRLCPPGVALADLPPIDVVVISHNHYDHMDLASLVALHRSRHPTFVVPLGSAKTLVGAGIDRVIEADWYAAQTIAAQPVVVTPVPAQHWSMRTPLDRNRALWSGYVLDVDGARILFAGDTGMGPHFKDIGARMGPIDVALLPIGAYCPRRFMAPQHMDPAQAVQAFVDVGAARALGTHYGTFQLANEGLDAPTQALAAALGRRQMPQDLFCAPRIGESVRITPARHPPAGR